ncbi:hypothetical protein AVEN_107175-1 [Araneus ventricosus]|uniref:SHSP domain-containing protein n=1 Tax=Araneus ventricosus TaxID=182803 RepID=A0A4Y2FHC6_ARAVE|nr:hypothetical protein AVEN_107175-1 [Araneus ventricosus]
MESKIIKHLKDFWSYFYSLALDDKNSEDLMKLDLGILDEVATTAQRELASKILCLSKQLGNVAKTSKSIRQQCRLDNCNKDTDEDITAEFFQEQEPSRNANTAEDEIAESSREMPVEPSTERKRFRVLMDVSNFSAKEVDVKVIEKYLVIHAKHGILADDHGTISREFTRKFEIPEDVDIETFRALIDCYGVLTVEASFKPMNVKDEALVILVDTHGKTSLQPYEDLGQGFQELAKHQIKDGMDMKDFARNLAKQRPSDYIPLEEVI